MSQPFGCRVCGTLVPPTISKVNPNRKYQSQFCSLVCRKLHLKSYFSKWSNENKEQIAAQRDANREQVRAWNREFYARHRDRRKKLRVEQYRANPEKALAAAKEYAASHPELIRKIGRKSRLQRRARLVEAFVEFVDPAVVFERDKGICGICRLPVDASSFDIDHVIPLSKGGEHRYSNVQVAHSRCNRRKGAKLPRDSG
jgi:hypothetical protein